MNAYLIECFKIIKSKRFPLFILTFIMILIINIYVLKINAHNELPKIKLENNKNLLVEYRTKLDNPYLEGAMKKEYATKIKTLEKENKDLQDEIQNPNNNWKKKLRNQNKLIKEENENLKIGLKYNELEENNKIISINNYLLENSIEPRKNYELYALYDFPKILDFVNVIFLPLLILILIYDIVSNEFNCKTIKSLATKPLTRSNIILSKFFAALTISLLSIFILEILAFLYLALRFQLGCSTYPISIGTNYSFNEFTPILNSSYLINSSFYILKLFLMQGAFIVTCTSFITFISTIFVNNISSLLTSVIIIFSLSSVTFILPQNILSKIYPFLFTTYSNAVTLIDGSLNLSLKNNFLSPPLGIVTCFLYAVFFLILSCLHFSKKDLIA